MTFIENIIKKTKRCRYRVLSLFLKRISEIIELKDTIDKKIKEINEQKKNDNLAIITKNQKKKGKRRINKKKIISNLNL